MKTLYEIQKILNEPIKGHPSRDDQQRIDRLEKIVRKLALQIDILQLSKQDKPNE